MYVPVPVFVCTVFPPTKAQVFISFPALWVFKQVRLCVVYLAFKFIRLIFERGVYLGKAFIRGNIVCVCTHACLKAPVPKL